MENAKMKNLPFILLLVFIFASLTGYSQTEDYPAGSKDVFNKRPGLINITELNVGIGLYRLDTDYARQLYNLSSIFGIGLAKNFTGGIGAGVSLYNGGGLLVPLFADFRYFTSIGKTRVFVFGDGGILLNPAKTEDRPKIFASPGIGMVLPVGNKLSVSLGTGLITQFYKDFRHDSFIYIKHGMTYSFSKKRN